MANPHANMPLVLQSSTKTNKSHSKTSSVQTSNSVQYFTPQISIQSNKTLSDSDPTLTDHSSTDDTDNEDSVNLSTKHVRSNISIPEIDVQLKSQLEETTFFPRSSSKDLVNTTNNPFEKLINTTNKPIRKCDKIRSLFKKKSRRLNSNMSDTNTIEWDEILVKTLSSMQHDAQEIIIGLNEIDQPITNDSRSNRSQSIITKPRLSFVERQREKIELMRIAQMLYPPNLLTYNTKESPYPYTDLVEPYNIYFLRMTKRLPEENLFIQHKPFRHKKLLYRTQRGLLKMRHDYVKIKHTLHGKLPFKSHQEIPSFYVQNYRIRLEKNFLEVRKQIDEYERIVSLNYNNHRPSIREIIEKLNTTDSTINAQIENYRAKLRPIEYIDKNRRYELNSAPYIPFRARDRSDKTKKDDKNDCLVNKYFNPTTMVDLNEQVHDFFGPDLPFWDQSLEPKLSASSPSIICQSDQFILPSKLGAGHHFIDSFRSRQKKLRNTQSISFDNNNDNLSQKSDEYFDCISLSSQQRKSESLLFSTNEQYITEF